MPQQIKRLIIYFAVFIALFLLVRQLLVPESFGQYGHYRGLSLEENADKPLHYAGSEACAMCHEDIAMGKSGDLHDVLSCEGCHGPGMNHVNEPDTARLIMPEGRDFCTRCHAMHPARNRNVIFQIDPEEHNTDNECIDCHNPHMPWELADQNTPEEPS